MSEEKQIEEMGEIIHKVENLEWLEDTIAEALYNAGYRKQSDNAVELPCKVGDTVYSIKATYSKCRLGCYWDAMSCGGCECECDSRATYEVQEERVLSIAFNGGSWSVMTNASHSNYKSIGLPNRHSVFLTKDEAGKTLATMKGGVEK